MEVGIIVAFGLLLLALKRYRSAVLAALVAAAWAWLCASPAFATWLQQELQDQYPLRPATSYPTAQAIVVLSGSDFPHSSRRRRAHAAAPTTRAGFGLRLYQAGDASVILLSGGGGGALRMAWTLRRQGVPASALRTETRSDSTHENALYSAQILERENKQRILLVTSAMDMPRAVASFRQQGLTVIPAPVPHLVHWLGGPQQGWGPQQRAIYLTSRCLHEYLGFLAYKLLGWA